MSFEPQVDLSKALNRARQSAVLIASLFGTWEKVFGGTIADALSAGPEAVSALGLCRRPREDRWADDIAEIAAACRLDEGRVAAVMRQALVAEHLAAAPPVGNVVDGRLLAARDREDDEQP